MFASFLIPEKEKKNNENYSENTEVRLVVGARCYLIMKAVFNSILFAEKFKKRNKSALLSVCRLYIVLMFCH